MRFIHSLIYSNQQWVRVSRHFLFWFVDMINWLMVKSISSEVVPADVHFFLLNVPVAMAVTYITLYHLIPKYSANEKGNLFISILILLLVMGCFFRVYKFTVVHPLLDLTPIASSDLWSLGAIISEVFKWLAVIAMAVAIKLVKSKTELHQKNEQLINEKRAAELSFLKTQMHPHFLFNTLNTLYSEAYQQSERAGLVVAHLANLLRFILEECSKPTISLEKEIKVIKDYIELEKMRHDSRLGVHLTVPESVHSISVSPLLFLPFVENSFKHSLNNVRGRVIISIEIKIIDERGLCLIVENDRAKHEEANGFSGKGIANIRRQLELLYKDEYRLDIKETDTMYKVELVIPIKKTAMI